LNKPDDKSQATVLLNADMLYPGCYLEPVDKDKCSKILIKDFPFVIGKQKGNVDYFLDKEEVSRYHVKITKEEDSYYITDLNSTNGTSLNNKPLSCYQRHRIIKDDKVSIAGINYKFQL
jgi:pSer/pThr/pTyr-binding forkhead associated (FHA) protein